MFVETWLLRRSIATVPEMHELLRGCYERFSIDPATAFCLDLAAEEVFTNLVRHNPSDEKFVTMTVECTPQEVHLQWIDRGVPRFEPSAEQLAVDVTRPISQRRPGGLGLHLTRSVVDALTFGYENGDMTVGVVKRLGSDREETVK